MHEASVQENMQAAPGSPNSGSADASPVTLVSLAAVTWDFPLVGRTRMLTEAWLRRGQPTIFVQVPSYRSALERITSPLRPRAAAPVVRPWPTWPSRWWSRLGPPRLARAIRRPARALRRQLEKRLAWERAVALVVTPVWAPWLDDLPFRHVVYDCIDELEVHVRRPELAPLYRAWEDRLVQRANGAVVTAKRLGDALRARRPDLPIALIRNGVDVERFQSLAASTPRPGDVPMSERPVVGFIGALYDWIDWPLIRATAGRLSEFDFVFVGPHGRRGDVASVVSLPNVRLLGPRPYAKVPAYVDTFAVCWVPFRQNEVGTAANPVKIYEYLALGKPVVSTPVADMDTFGEVVDVARTPEEMAQRLRAAVTAPPSSAEARISFARQNTWEVRAQEYLDFIARLAVG